MTVFEDLYSYRTALWQREIGLVKAEGSWPDHEIQRKFASTQAGRVSPLVLDAYSFNTRQAPWLAERVSIPNSGGSACCLGLAQMSLKIAKGRFACGDYGVRVKEGAIYNNKGTGSPYLQVGLNSHTHKTCLEWLCYRLSLCNSDIELLI